MSKTTEIAFFGEVRPGTCACHAGQWFIGVMCITPSGPVPAGHDWFPTEEAANASMEETVKKHAKAWLDDCGIKIEDAVRMTVAHGDDAVKMTNKVAREINENLH